MPIHDAPQLRNPELSHCNLIGIHNVKAPEEAYNHPFR